MTSVGLLTSGRKLSRNKTGENAAFDGVGWNYFLEIGLTSLAASGRLQRIIKYCTKVHKNGSGRTRSRIIRPLVKRESPNLAWTSRSRCSRVAPAGCDVTSYFRSPFIEVLKCCIRRLWVEFSGAAFCLPHQLVGFLLNYLAGLKGVSAHRHALDTMTNTAL